MKKKETNAPFALLVLTTTAEEKKFAFSVLKMQSSSIIKMQADSESSSAREARSFPEEFPVLAQSIRESSMLQSRTHVRSLFSPILMTN